MSASYVREKTRDWARQISAVAGNPQYYDTINTEQDPADSVFWTMSYNAEMYDGETFCGPGHIETGFIRVVVLSAPGIGDLPALQALETVVPQMLAQVDPTQRLKITGFEPAYEESAGTAEKHYRIGAILNYKLDL